MVCSGFFHLTRETSFIICYAFIYSQNLHFSFYKFTAKEIPKTAWIPGFKYLDHYTNTRLPKYKITICYQRAGRTTQLDKALNTVNTLSIFIVYTVLCFQFQVDSSSSIFRVDRGHAVGSVRSRLYVLLYVSLLCCNC